MTEITKDFKNLKIQQGLDKIIQEIFDEYSTEEQYSIQKEKSKKPTVIQNARKKWEQIKRKKEKAKKEAEEERLLRSITKRYGYDGDDDFGDVYSSFGKKQKKDIKGMIKKILLYGGLPLLLLVSLGVLSNTKLKGKQNTKVEKDSNEIKFKKKFATMIEQVIIRKHDEFRKLGEEQKQEMIATSKRHNLRNVKFLTPEKPPLPSVSSVSTVKQKPLTKEERLRMVKIRMKKNPPSPFDPNTYIKISQKKDSFSYVKEKKQANLKIDKDGEVWEKPIKKTVWTPSKNYYWNPEKEMITFRRGGTIIDIPVLKLKV